MTELLPPYYLDNLRFLLDWVVKHYPDLLNEGEREFIANFVQLQRDSQCLLVCMIGRKGVWFRASKLRYAEIKNPVTATDELLAAKLSWLNFFNKHKIPAELCYVSWRQDSYEP